MHKTAERASFSKGSGMAKWLTDSNLLQSALGTEIALDAHPTLGEQLVLVASSRGSLCPRGVFEEDLLRDVCAHLHIFSLALLIIMLSCSVVSNPL